MKKDSKQRLFEVMTRLDKTFKPKLNESINELNIDTYAKQMNTTHNYPWDKFFASRGGDNNNNKRPDWDKKGSVNNLSRDRFIEEFYKIYPMGTTVIQTNQGEYAFSGIDFNAGYTLYGLFFKGKHSDYEGQTVQILIQHSKVGNNMPQKDGYYIDYNANKHIEITDPKSEELIMDMLKYNVGRDANSFNPKIKGINENDSEQFFPVSTPVGSEDDALFIEIINQGIDSSLEGFTKSNFEVKPGSLGNRRIFNFHKDELPILLRRLGEIGTPEAQQWIEDIQNQENNIQELEETNTFQP